MTMYMTVKYIFMIKIFISDDNGPSPWNSDNDIDSVCSVTEIRSAAGSVASRNSRRRDPIMSRSTVAHDIGPVENVVATLRMLVALEDYLGSIGPKIVDLLTEALKMEKVSYILLLWTSGDRIWVRCVSIKTISGRSDLEI